MKSLSGMSWRIRACGDGRFAAEYGAEHKGGESAASGVGVTMPAFLVYRMARFETRKQAERFVKRCEAE